MHAAIMNLHAGQMLQDTALSDLLERHSCERAALDRVFVDASERDTPGDSIVSVLCVISLVWHSIPPGCWEVTCCGRGCCCSRCLPHSALLCAQRCKHASHWCCPACAGEFSNAFACRLTLEPFREPATTPSGLSYERSALLNHLKSVSTAAS